MQFIARLGAGVNPEQMHAERVNGTTPAGHRGHAPQEAVLAEGRGPALLDTITYRISGHRPRTLQAIARRRSRALVAGGFHPHFPRQLVAAAPPPMRPWPRARGRRDDRLRNVPHGHDSGSAPRGRGFRTGRRGDVLQRKVEKFDDRKPEFLQDLAQNPRVQQIRGKIRTPTFEGKASPR